MVHNFLKIKLLSWFLRYKKYQFLHTEKKKGSSYFNFMRWNDDEYITCNDAIEILGGETIDFALLVFWGAFTVDVFNSCIGVAKPFH